MDSPQKIEGEVKADVTGEAAKVEGSVMTFVKARITTLMGVGCFIAGALVLVANAYSLQWTLLMRPG